MIKRFLLSLIILFASISQLDAYSFSRTFTVDHTKVPNTNQTNFPILISGTYDGTSSTPNWKTVGNSGKIQNTTTQTGGGDTTSSFPADLIFTSDSACTTKLSWEWESYVASTGVLVVWVNIATLSYTVDTVIYACYGDSTVTTWQGNVTGTWSSNYKAVLHLPDGTTLGAKDSTSTGNNGTISNATAVAGNIDGAANFNGTTSKITFSGIDSGNAASVSYTLSLWFYPIPTSDGYASLWSAGATSGLFYRGSTRKLDFYASGDHLSSTAITENQWNYIVVTVSGTGNAIAFYLNSTADGTSTGNFPIYTTMGDDASSETFKGYINEARLFIDKTSNTAGMRSTDWITTEYNNQSSVSTFYSIGSEVSLSVSGFMMLIGVGK